MAFLVFFLLAVTPAFSHEDEVHADETPTFSDESLKACLSLQSGRAECYGSLCGDGPTYPCAQEILAAVVVVESPERAMMVMADIMQGLQWVEVVSDPHLLVHSVGRSMAKNFGSTGDVFVQCPRNFNNGCFHGFFEHALLDVDDPVAVASDICESMTEDVSFKEKFYCYHGAGHVFMLNEAYDVDASLKLCLVLGDPWSEGCWQGVFMENAFRGYENRKENFREDDPLYPCNVVQDKFKRQCYINHHSYLINHYSPNLKDLLEVCMGAGEFAEHCLAGLGLYFSSGYGAGAYDNEFGIAHLSHLEKIVFLCSRFPEGHVESCNENAIAGILNDDAGSMVRVSRLCGYVQESGRRACFESAGRHLPNLIPDKEQRIKACSIVPAEYREACSGVDRQPVRDGSSGESRFSFLKHRWSTFKIWLLGFFRGFPAAEEPAADAANTSVPGTDYGQSGNASVKAAADESRSVLAPDADSEKLLYDDAFMDEAIQNYTLRSLTQSLSRLGSEKGIDCHNRAHELGRRSYELLGGVAFKECGIECHSGCRHGATEAFFADRGSADLVESIKVMCEEETTTFGLHQCLHGVGHGLIAWYDYGLHEALEACDLIELQFHRESCYTGVFMENIVGGIARSDSSESEGYHYTDWLNDDPHYPCSAVGDEYKNSCYFLQTDRMLQLGGVELVRDACSEAPERFRFSCFVSMGRTVSGSFLRDPAQSFSACAAVSNASDRDACLWGAVADQLWDETQTNDALEMCRLSRNLSFGKTCYDQVIVRGSEVVSESSRENFCKKFPDEYYEPCINQKAPQALNISGTEEDLPGIEKSDGAVIRYVNGSYVPDTVHVSVGSEVTWINDDEAFWPASNLHPTHTAYPGSGINKCPTSERERIFDSCQPLGLGAEYSFRFNETGEWRFHDHVTPRATGTVIVS